MYRLTLLGLLLALATIFNFWIADDRLWAGICFLGSMTCFILHAAIQDLFRDATAIMNYINFGNRNHGWTTVEEVREMGRPNRHG